MPKFILASILFFSVTFQLLANEKQDSTAIIDAPKANFNGAYFKSYLLDIRDVAVSPFQPTKNRLIGYGIAAAGFTVLYTQDENIRSYVQENRTDKSDWYSTHVFEPMGAGDYSMGLMASMYISGLVAKKPRLAKTALLGVKAYLVSGVFARIPKYGFRRERPHANHGANQWFSEWGNTSFISGHTTSAFSVATIIASEYKSTIWVPVLAYSMATLSGFSRIHDDKHWASDVFCGAMFGYGIAKLIHNQNNWGVQVYPYVSPDDGGVSFVFPI